MNRTALLTALAPLIWGTTYLTTTQLLPPERPFLTATLRALPAGLLLLAITRTLPRGHWWWKAATLGALNIGGFFGLMFVSAYRLPGGVAATLPAIHPLLVAALAGLVVHERVRPLARVAAAVGFLGVAAIVLTPDARLDAWGVAAGLLAGASTAGGVLLTKRWGRPVPLLTFTAWQLVAGGVVLAVPMVLLEGAPPSLTPTNLAGYLWLALPGTALAYLLWFRGLLTLPSVAVSVLSFLTPLTAGVLGWIVLGESLNALQLTGAGAVLAAVGLVSWASRPAARASIVPRQARDPEVALR